MTNKIIVLEEGQKIEIEKSMLSHGLFDFSLIKCENFDEMLETAKANKSENVLIVCKNKHIDKLVESLSGSGDSLSLVSEQAVKIQGEGKTLIVPVELQLENFLDDFVITNPVYSCSIFGKGANMIAEKFDGLGVSYKIITKSTFLHTIFYNKFIDEALLSSVFGENLYSFSGLSLQEECAKNLGEKKISVVENFTGGSVAGRLSENIELKSAKILLSQADYDGIGMDEIFLEEHGYGKDLVYEIAKKMLSSCDVALAVTGGSDGKCFVAVGDKENIHVFSSAFSGERSEILNNISSFALFRLLRFLKQK